MEDMRRGKKAEGRRMKEDLKGKTTTNAKVEILYRLGPVLR